MVRRLLRKLVLLTYCVLPLLIVGYFVIFVSDNEGFNRRISRHVERISSPTCKDWNDDEFMTFERGRKGHGERGEAVILTDKLEIELNQKLYNETGFAVVISDKISVNRSIPDLRPKRCKDFKYLSKLPNVSVIIIFRNEVKSVLLRTIHSVINRTPTELLHEIILVNDNSTNAELYEPLQQYVNKHFPPKVKIKNLTERKGLIVTRLEGARIATGEVLVFFDSHIEVGYNWLPPLLDPIARNRRLATVPIIDDFEPETFEVFSNQEFGTRGSIDWMLIYRHFPRYLPDGGDVLKPFPVPVMLGCAFAIDRKFFLDELGGYDEGFQVWNGENYELSFKLWLCADGLFEVPCSRVTHSFRLINPSRNDNGDFVAHNFKRLAEVWMDEFKEVIFSFDRERYNKVDAGDLTVPKAVRERLNCKSFKYFMDEIAPDILTRYPTTKETPVFASGQIKSLADEKVCIDTFYRSEFDPIGLFYCQELDGNNQPPQSQFFRLTFMKNIVFGFIENCLDSYKMSIPQCTYFTYGNQYWKYDRVSHMLINGGDDSDHCLTAVFLNQTITMELCDENNFNQKWSFTYENETALNDWKNIYGYTKFVYGDKEINYENMGPLDQLTCEA